MSDEDPILQQRSEGVLWLWLNRPHRLNAVSEEMYDQLITTLHHAEGDGVRAVVITGTGRAFCAGADLKAHAADEGSSEDRRAYVLAGQQANKAIQDCPLPVLAAVNGYALGAGAEMALSCDLVVMAEDAEMGFPELSLGTYVGGGLTHLLPRLVGLARARQLLFTAERFTGRQAHEWGLVHDVAPAEELLAAAEALAQRVAAMAPLAVRYAKTHLANAAASVEVAMEQEARALMELMETEDWAEGVAAFAEKRTPRFEGR